MKLLLTQLPLSEILPATHVGLEACQQKLLLLRLEGKQDLRPSLLDSPAAGSSGYQQDTPEEFHLPEGGARLSKSSFRVFQNYLSF